MFRISLWNQGMLFRVRCFSTRQQAEDFLAEIRLWLVEKGEEAPFTHALREW